MLMTLENKLNKCNLEKFKCEEKQIVESKVSLI